MPKKILDDLKVGGKVEIQDESTIGGHVIYHEDNLPPQIPGPACNDGIDGQDGVDAADSPIIQIREAFVLALSRSYKEMIYNNVNRVATIEYYEDNTKVNHLFTKVFTYNSYGLPSQVVLTDHLTSNVLTKTIVYKANLTVESVTEVIS